MNNQRERKNKSGGAVMPAILAVVFAISAAGESIVSSPAASVIVLILTVILIFAAVFFVIKRLLKSAGLRGSAAKPAGKKLAFRADPAEDKVFTASGASKGPVEYNPRSAEELFQRDHEKRLAQLDVFLKNGIIDKKEYALLRQRYEKISYERN